MAKQLKYQFDIDGKTLTMDFGMYCWEVFCEKMDIRPEDMVLSFDGPSTFKRMRMVAVCGSIANDYLEDNPDPMSEKEITRILNGNPEITKTIFETAMSTFFGTEKEDMDGSAKAADGDKKPKKKVSHSERLKK